MRIPIDQIFPGLARQMIFHALHRDAILHRTNQRAEITAHAFFFIHARHARARSRLIRRLRSSLGIGVIEIRARLAASIVGGVACAPFK